MDAVQVHRAVDGGNESVIDGLIGVGLLFVVVNSSFSDCSAIYQEGIHCM